VLDYAQIIEQIFGKWGISKVVAEKRPASPALAESLAVIGRQLREQRQAQSLSIAEISGRTKIQPRLLQAIEAGDLTQLPEPVYIQRFIEYFAGALGLQPKEISQSFSVNLPPQFPDASRRQGTAGAPFQGIRLYFIYGALLAAIAGGLLYFNRYSAQPHSPSTAAAAR